MTRPADCPAHGPFSGPSCPTCEDWRRRAWRRETRRNPSISAELIVPGVIQVLTAAREALGPTRDECQQLTFSQLCDAIRKTDETHDRAVRLVRETLAALTEEFYGG